MIDFHPDVVVSATFKNANSAKQYDVVIKPASTTQFDVHFGYGRIGSAFKWGVKNTSPLDIDTARTVATRLMQSKLKKGYVLSNESQSTVVTPLIASDTVHSAMLPQLANPVTTAQLQSLVLNHTLLLQDKKDGMRAVVRVMNRRNVMITNRRGVAISVRSDIVNELIALAEQLECDRLEFDCELMGWGLYIFDILAMKECVRHQSHALRLSYLGSLDRHLAGFMALKVAKTTIVTKDNDILEHCIEANRLRGEEGLIIRLADAHYEKGRPNSFGSVLKLKHVQDITCVVIGASANKRSVELGLYDHQGQLCEVGKVTIPANENVPTTGALVDVRYLWVIGEGGKLIQPVFNGVRTDYEAKECHVDKLVYRDEAIMLNVAEA